MKFVYIDESGNSSDPYLAFFGLQVDAYRLKSAGRQVVAVFERIHDAYPEDLRELKSSKLVNGAGGWRRVDPEDRKVMFLDLCRFPDEHQHKCFAYVLDVKRYRSEVDKPEWAQSPWLSAAMTLVASVQSENRKLKKNKGQSVLVFDHNAAEIPALTTNIAHQHKDFRDGSGSPFGALVDTAFSIRSEQSSLVQVADACALALRRRAELTTGEREPQWEGERDFIEEAYSAFAGRLFHPRIKCPAADWIGSVGCDA